MYVKDTMKWHQKAVKMANIYNYNYNFKCNKYWESDKMEISTLLVKMQFGDY